MTSIKRILVLMLAVMLFAFVGCNDADKTEDKKDSQKVEENNEEAAIPEDVWFNLQGQHGTVEYEYMYNGTFLAKTTFRLESGEIWRTIEHGSYEDNAYSDVINSQSIYSADGTLLYTVKSVNQTNEFTQEKFPQWENSYDHKENELSSDIHYNTAGIRETFTLDNEYNGAYDYCVISYKSANEIDKIVHYNRDGVRECAYYAFYENGKLEYLAKGDGYYNIPYKFYHIESEGNTTKLMFGTGNADYKNRKVTSYSPDSNPNEIFTVTYDADGKISSIEAISFGDIGIAEFKGTETVYYYGGAYDDKEELSKVTSYLDENGKLASSIVSE